MNSADSFDKYYLPTAQRHALWENEISMFVVLMLPLAVATFWYGSTVQVVDFAGRVITPALVSRGVGLTVVITLFAIGGGATYLFAQPATDRLRNAQPVRGQRRLAFAAFDGLLVGLITYQSMPEMRILDGAVVATITIALAVAAGLIAYVAMHSMVDLPSDQDAAVGQDAA